MTSRGPSRELRAEMVAYSCLHIHSRIADTLFGRSNWKVFGNLEQTAALASRMWG